MKQENEINVLSSVGKARKRGLQKEKLVEMGQHRKWDTTISGIEVRKINDSQKIWVNSVRLNGLLSKIVRDDKENQKKAIAQKINGILNENDNGREVYVPMSAKDVRFCFENQLENMPQNTFCLRPSTVQKRKMVSR